MAWVWGYRRQSSLLVEAGHLAARNYPLGMLADEAKLVVQRRNGLQATEAVLTRDAISAVLSKQGAERFKKVLKGLTEG